MSKSEIVVTELTDRELQVAWAAICAFCEWTYTFPFPSSVDGLSEKELKLYNEGAESRHEVFEIVAKVLFDSISETRYIKLGLSRESLEQPSQTPPAKPDLAGEETE